MVDQETKFVLAIPVPNKEVTGFLVEEVCRVLMLMNPRVILRTDTDPVSLRKKVQGRRQITLKADHQTMYGKGRWSIANERD